MAPILPPACILPQLRECHPVALALALARALLEPAQAQAQALLALDLGQGLGLAVSVRRLSKALGCLLVIHPHHIETQWFHRQLSHQSQGPAVAQRLLLACPQGCPLDCPQGRLQAHQRQDAPLSSAVIHPHHIRIPLSSNRSSHQSHHLVVTAHLRLQAC